MTHSSLKIKRILFFLGDILLLYLSLWLTLVIRYYGEYSVNLWNKHLFPFSIVFIIWLIIFYIDELYEFDIGRGRMNLINKLIRSLLISGGIAVTFFYLGHNRLFSIRPQRILLIDLAITFLLLFVWRQIFYNFIKSPKLAQNVMIVGVNQLTTEVIKKMNLNPQLGFKLKTIVNYEGKNLEDLKLSEDVSIINDVNQLKAACLKDQIDLIVSAAKPRGDSLLLKNLFNCLKLQVDFLELATFYEKITGKIPVDAIEHDWFLSNLSESSKKFYEIIKRIFDFSAAIVGLMISAPFVPFIILIIKLDSKGPFLFTQTRVGKNGKNFLAMKFRTMKVDAEISGPQWAQKNDPRITRVGGFLRKTRIDEIPQLINVLRGEMSLIGPRPERPEFVQTLKEKIPFYEERLLVKPGLTGWAQVMGPAYGGSEKESLEKLQYDLFYIKNRSLGLDLIIILKTVKIILSGSGQ
jgi:sugar transferase (PEP-CTERM system associated)